MAEEMKGVYLIHGSDVAKIDQARNRLRARAEADGGTASLEVFEPREGRGSPDVEALVQAVASMALIPGRRYLLADGIEKWGSRQVETVSEALGGLPPETTVVLIARGKVPAAIRAAAEKAGGQILGYEAPLRAELPAYLIEGASRRGFELDPEAARFLVASIGESLTRLENELDRLALWAGSGGRVELEDLQEMVSDLNEASVFALGDAVVSQDLALALNTAERLGRQGSGPNAVLYPTATAVRRAHRALSLLEQGQPPKTVESELGLPPFLVRKIVESVRGASLESIRSASIALSDLERWTRGAAEYPDELALDLALLAAAGES